MKIRNNFILITALCLVAFALGACDYWEPADQSSININFDDSNVRAVLDEDKSEMTYTITLTSPGKDSITRTTGKGETFISIPVSEGVWSIQVQGEGRRRVGEGAASVAVTAGKPASVPVKMNVIGTKVYEWKELMADFNDVSLPNEFSIEIIGKTLEAYSSSGANDNENSTKVITLNTGKTITLRANEKEGLTILRKNINDDIKVNVFRITNGTLILDGKTGGKIIIDGIKSSLGQKNCTRALINVENSSSAKLIMLEEVFLRNNITDLGGGVYVKKGIFEMKGGTISGNTAKDKGGGVYIAELKDGGGTFIKTGGTIHGSEDGLDEDRKNKAGDKGGGDALYYSGTKTEDNTF